MTRPFKGFAFHIQLWFLGLSTVICQVLAIYFIKKRNFALHLGFQIYTFAAFLNAPIQRYDCAVLGQIYPHLTQGEVNNLVNILTFWQCLLIGYLLFAWNRSASPVRKTPVPIEPQPMGLKVFLTLAAVTAVISSLAMYILSPRFGQLDGHPAKLYQPRRLRPTPLCMMGKPCKRRCSDWEFRVRLFSGIYLMIRDEQSRVARRIFYVSAIGAGIQQMLWGYQLGEPSLAVTSGGGFYLVSGVSLLGFALLAMFFEHRGKQQHVARGDGLCRELCLCACDCSVGPCTVVLS